MTTSEPEMDTDGRISRRTLLAGLAVAMATNACSGSPSGSNGSPSSSAPLSVPLATAEMEAWVAAAGSQFNTAGYTLQLAGVEPLRLVGTRPAQLRQQPFIAIFDVPVGGNMPGNLIYRIFHRSIPTFDIFLTEASSPAYPTRMYALFN